MDALSHLAGIRSIEALIGALRASARAIGVADGITVVRRQGDKVAYVAEDAVSPLWTGQALPIEACISGLAMIENRPVLIEDIYADARVPHAAYEATFVKRMAMFPIGAGDPQMALGAYWGTPGPIEAETVSLLSSLARAASQAFERCASREAASTEGERQTR